MAAKLAIDLDERYADKSDLEIQLREVRVNDQTLDIMMVLYAWLSEKRKEGNAKGKVWGWQYCPFNEGDKVIKERFGMKFTGKITTICRDYYGGDCLVLYVKLDKRSSKKYMQKHADVSVNKTQGL